MVVKKLTAVGDICDLFTEAVKNSIGAYIGLKLKNSDIRIQDVDLSDFPIMLFSIEDNKKQSIIIKFGYTIAEKEYQFISECPSKKSLIVFIGFSKPVCKCYTLNHGEISPSGDDILRYKLYKAFQKGILGGYLVNGGIRCDVADELVMGCSKYFEILIDAANCRGLYEMEDRFIEPFYLHLDQTKQGVNAKHPSYYITVERAKDIIDNYDELVSEPYNYKIYLNRYVTTDNIRGNVLYYDIVIYRGSLCTVLISLLDNNFDMTSAVRHRISKLPEGIVESVSIYRGHFEKLDHPNWIRSIYRSSEGEFLEAFDEYIETTSLACATEIKINLDKAF